MVPRAGLAPATQGSSGLRSTLELPGDKMAEAVGIEPTYHCLTNNFITVMIHLYENWLMMQDLNLH